MYITESNRSIGVCGTEHLDIIDDDYFDCETTIKVIYLL